VGRLARRTRLPQCFGTQGFTGRPSPPSLAWTFLAQFLASWFLFASDGGVAARTTHQLGSFQEGCQSKGLRGFVLGFVPITRFKSKGLSSSFLASFGFVFCVKSLIPRRLTASSDPFAAFLSDGPRPSSLFLSTGNFLLGTWRCLATACRSVGSALPADRRRPMRATTCYHRARARRRGTWRVWALREAGNSVTGAPWRRPASASESRP